MGLIIPHGPTVKRITLKIDDKGNSNIEGVDLRNFIRVPGRPEQPLPLSALETLYWLTKCASDALAQTINNLEKAKRPPGDPGLVADFRQAVNDENQKTD